MRTGGRGEREQAQSREGGGADDVPALLRHLRLGGLLGVGRIEVDLSKKRKPLVVGLL